MHHKRTLLTLAVGALAVVSAACGNSSDDDNAKAGDAERTVNVEMVDVAFKPTEVTVAKGETVRFVFKNNGKTEHEAFLGTPAEQKDHDKEMSGEDSGGHDMGNMGGGDETAVTVDPGKTDEFTTRFDDAGTYEIGCHEPGHYTAGMKITVTVS
jgi:uncharacterized cupredoxin-like copper-binding protein